MRVHGRRRQSESRKARYARGGTVVSTMLRSMRAWICMDVYGCAHSRECLAALPSAQMAFGGAVGPFWALHHELQPAELRAASIALVNSIGNLGGFVGPCATARAAAREHAHTSHCVRVVHSSHLCPCVAARACSRLLPTRRVRCHVAARGTTNCSYRDALRTASLSHDVRRYSLSAFQTWLGPACPGPTTPVNATHTTMGLADVLIDLYHTPPRQGHKNCVTSWAFGMVVVNGGVLVVFVCVTACLLVAVRATLRSRADV